MSDIVDRLRAALGDRYRLERELGAGGMAIVYLAEDLKHARKVAIKVLKPELAQSLTGERFLREIAITARLNHPHILALLDSGADASGELLYYVMPLVTGASRRERLAADGVLPTADALRIASDVPSVGIAHRDQVVRWMTEMRRSVDYAFSRPDIDTTRVAYVGTSWGARNGGVALAVEPRFHTAILNVPGINANAVRPEEDPVNFLPRIRMPVLMLSGRSDSVFPYESSQVPFLRLLGSPPGAKTQVLFEGGHFLPRNLWVSESTRWLDQQLGPVSRP